MTTYLTIIALAFANLTKGQSCGTIKGEIINCIDSAGLKQGYWKETRKKVLLSWYGGLGSKEGCRYGEDVVYLPVAEGYYQDNQKVGTWKYYSNNDHLISVDREITYFKDGGIKDDNFLEWYSIQLNNDTSIVSGYIFHDKDSVRVECKMGTCRFELTNRKELLSFTLFEYFKLEYEMLRVTSGTYDIDIKKLNAR